MKLYRFNPNNYGLEWFVMSDSEENAINALNEHLKNEFLKNPLVDVDAGDEPLQWGDSYFKPTNFEKGYTIDVYDVNQVFESEIA
jgi:hypothetical protein